MKLSGRMLASRFARTDPESVNTIHVCPSSNIAQRNPSKRIGNCVPARPCHDLGEKWRCPGVAVSSVAVNRSLKRKKRFI